MKIVIRILLVLLIAAVLAYYLYDVFISKSDPMDHLLQTVSVILVCIGGLIRTFANRGRKSLSFYAGQYPDILDGVFHKRPFCRRKLLKAIRCYNEDKYGNAIRMLAKLTKRCRDKKEHYAVNLFAALCYTDMDCNDMAEKIYLQMIQKNLGNSRIYSNLGLIYGALGEHHKALNCYQNALTYDRNNPYAYNNIAQAYFRIHEFEEAIPYAEKALEKNARLHQASSLLAIIYDLMGEKEKAEKYFHMSISSGRDPKELREAMEFYRQ